MRQVNFAKGHGSKNDFVIVADRHGVSPLSQQDVRFLCDRHGGIGADGVLRVIKAAHIPHWDGDPALWFMDYRNADGSIAEMCGNGLRVFARYLQEEDLVAEDVLTVATRAGARRVMFHNDGLIQVDMGQVRVCSDEATVWLGSRSMAAVGVNVGNPHAVAFVDAEALPELDLGTPPRVEPTQMFRRGANVEFVARRGERDLSMRVFERGVGETMSCGTGIVAAAAVADTALNSAGGTYSVAVPGGVLSVELGNGNAWLTGPAVIVARGEVALPESA